MSNESFYELFAYHGEGNPLSSISTEDFDQYYGPKVDGFDREEVDGGVLVYRESGSRELVAAKFPHGNAFTRYKYWSVQ